MIRVTGGLVLPLVMIAGATAAGQQVPVLQATRDLTIEGKPSGFKLNSTSLHVSSDGTIALHNAQEPKVILVSDDGKHLQLLANNVGDKPGEFLQVGWNGWIGDSLWIADQNLDRITVFTPERKVARVVPIPTSIPGPPGTIPLQLPPGSMFSIPIVQAMYPDAGWLVTPPRLPMGMPKEPGLALIHLAPNGDFVAVLGHYGTSLPDCMIAIPLQGANFQSVNPFCGSPMNTWSPDGRSLLVVKGDLTGQDSGTYVVTRIGEHGDTVYRRMYPFSAVAIADRDAAADSIITRRVDAFRTAPNYKAGDLDLARQAFIKARPPIYPPIDHTLIANDGTAWLEVFGAEPEHRWIILDPTGAPVATVMLPANVRLAEVTRDRAWGKEILPDDQINIVQYHVGKAKP